MNMLKGKTVDLRKIKHEDVLINANKTKKIFSNYISEIIQNIEPQRKLKK